MDLVRQPPNSNLCGQACVATIAGVALGEAVTLCGKSGKTSTRHLIAGLKAKGFEPYCGLTRVCQRSPWITGLMKSATLIVKFKSGKASHWVVRHKGKFYDPAAGVFRDVPKYLESQGARLVSFLVVNRAEGIASREFT
jgi:hypothetical protein